MPGNPLVRFDEGRVGRNFRFFFIPVALSPTLPSLRAPIYRYASASLQYWKHFFTSVTGSALPRYSYSMNALIGHCLSRRS